MRTLNQELFICLDCETTGLDIQKDEIIEVAAVKFTFNEIIDRFETLIDPQCIIPQASQAIHNISQEMVTGKPKIKEIFPSLFSFIGNHPIVGHGISFDIQILQQAAQKNYLHQRINNPTIDTLRLARLYGQSPQNSLESLRKHFNIPYEGAHRAMNDVLVNIEVFKFLTKEFCSSKEIFKRLENPILLKNMPLGKHKGRSFEEIPQEYLKWAVNKDFDMDLIFSIKTELKKRKNGKNFYQSSNPFVSL